jgi:hypothetical protein
VTRASVVALAWAALLLGLGLVLWAIFTPPDATSYILPAAAALATALIALAARGRGPRPAATERVLALSPATATVTVGLAVVLVGLSVGAWMALTGAGIAALGVAGLFRERRA